MGLLGALGKRGMRALQSGEMFGQRAAIPSRVTPKDELMMRLMMDNPNATDDEIARVLEFMDADNPLSLARRYRERYAYHMGPNPRTWGT